MREFNIKNIENKSWFIALIILLWNLITLTLSFLTLLFSNADLSPFLIKLNIIISIFFFLTISAKTKQTYSIKSKFLISLFYLLYSTLISIVLTFKNIYSYKILFAKGIKALFEMNAIGFIQSGYIYAFHFLLSFIINFVIVYISIAIIYELAFILSSFSDYMYTKFFKTFGSFLSKTVLYTIIAAVLFIPIENPNTELAYLYSCVNNSSQSQHYTLDKSAQIYFRKGYYNMAEKKYNEAINYYKKVLEINPDYSDAYNKIGFSYEHMKDYKTAITYYEKAVRNNPGFCKSYHNLGVNYKRLGEPELAIQNFNSAIECCPKATAPYFGLAMLYKERKLNIAASATLIRYINNNPFKWYGYVSLFYISNDYLYKSLKLN